MAIAYYDYIPNLSSNVFDLLDSDSGHASKIKSIITEINSAFTGFDVIFVADSEHLKIQQKRADFSEKWNKFYSHKRPCIIVSPNDTNKTDDIKRTLFDNSNIWIRHIDFRGDRDIIKEHITKSIEYFSKCRSIELYDQESAEEYIDFHLRIQKDNFLSKGHKDFVFPYLYASEDIDLNKNIALNSELQGKVYFRILLIDDKLGNPSNTNVAGTCVCTGLNYNDTNGVIQPNDNFQCDSSSKECKLRIIKELIGLKYTNDQNDNVFWKHDNIQSFSLPKGTNINTDCKFDEEFSKYNAIQIFAVEDIKTATRFLSSENVKFDLILLDYLLGRNGENAREYGTELLEFINNLGTISNPGTEQKKEEQKKIRDKMLQSTGLENRFWIFPITAFESSFFTHLQSDGISLLTKKWYIYPPTNPIVTPNRFLRNLNEFVGLMVERSVYDENKLVEFFLRTCREFLSSSQWKTLSENDKKTKKVIQAYIPFIGSEYRRFIQLYGARLNVYRDKDFSLFAKSIWQEFYSKTNIGDPSASQLITLNYFMQKFFYASTYLTDDRQGKEKLHATWADLSGFLNSYFKRLITTTDRQVFDDFSSVIEKITFG